VPVRPGRQGPCGGAGALSSDLEALRPSAYHSRFNPLRETVELGYWLFAHARGRGVATRTVRALAKHAFANGIVRVEAHVRIGNGASERVLERVGFEREGIKRRLLRHGDRRGDEPLFALVAE